MPGKRKRSEAAKRGWRQRLARQLKRSEAAKRGWATRRRKAFERTTSTGQRRQLRSEAAKRGWATRRRKAEAKKELPNQEYLIEIKSRTKKVQYLSDKRSKLGRPDLLVIFDKGASETAVVAFAIFWLSEHGGDNEYLAAQLAGGDRDLRIAVGPLSREKKQVRVRFY